MTDPEHRGARAQIWWAAIRCRSNAQFAADYGAVSLDREHTQTPEERAAELGSLSAQGSVRSGLAPCDFGLPMSQANRDEGWVTFDLTPGRVG